jgi:hypothetical protein
MTDPRGLLLVLCCASACAAPAPTPAAAPAGAEAASVTNAPPPAAPASAVPPASTAAAPVPAAAKPLQLSAEPIALPGATAPVSLDFLFYEPGASRVWVPAGGSGSVDVFDTAKRDFTRVEGFKTVEREAHGKKRMLGPSAGAVGDGFAYIGNRASQEICAIDLHTLKKGACLKLADPTDCVEYVPSTHEVWVTTPSTHSLVVLDAAQGKLKLKATVKVDGEPEGYALDEPHGTFLTNLEDKGTTLSIDLKTRTVKSTWSTGCSADGPRGIAVDSARSLVFVACTDRVQVLDGAHDGAVLGSLDTGGGLDNIDYVADKGLLYAAAGKAARLTVAKVGEHGQLTVFASGETAQGARNAVADSSGNIYVADPQGAHLLVLRAPEPH